MGAKPGPPGCGEVSVLFEDIVCYREVGGGCGGGDHRTVQSPPVIQWTRTRHNTPVGKRSERNFLIFIFLFLIEIL